LPGSRSPAQLTDRYKPEELVGRLVVAVVNFRPRQIGPVLSDVETLGVPDRTGAVVLLAPDADVPLGGRVFWRISEAAPQTVEASPREAISLITPR